MFVLQIVAIDDPETVVTIPGGGALETDLIAAVTAGVCQRTRGKVFAPDGLQAEHFLQVCEDTIAARGVGLFCTEQHVRRDIRAGLVEILSREPGWVSKADLEIEAVVRDAVTEVVHALKAQTKAIIHDRQIPSGQDVGASGLEDGTYDVRGDLVGGTDTISASSVKGCTMSTGTKTVAWGDLIAIVCEFTARGGSDSVPIARGSGVGYFPYITADTGSGPAIVSAAPFIQFKADDGTQGWLMNSTVAAQAAPSSFASDSTPDEHAMIFRVPFKAQATGINMSVLSAGAADDFEAILYSDPLGTPVAERTISVDASFSGGGSIFDGAFSTAYTLSINTDYAIALRPTTVNGLTYCRLDFGSGNSALRASTMLGTNWYLATRSNQTGAFGSADTTIIPMFGVWLSQLSDDVSSGGGPASIISG